MGNKPKNGLRLGLDGQSRCFWCGDDPQYMAYHDTEWGRPLAGTAKDNRRLFEKICLEGFQSGLSWLTILRKRQNFREAFQNFDYKKVALFTRSDVNRLLENPGIVRHRGKIESTINNAKCAVALEKEFSQFWDYFCRYRPKNRPLVSPHRRSGVVSQEEIRLRWLITTSKTPESLALSNDLKKRGWSFVGPTTLYSFMQSVGIINDHLTGCSFR